jgi:hypothetical protein
MVATPLSQAVLAGMDPRIYGSLQDMQQGQALSQQGMDSSPTTGWGALGRLANAAAGSYISNSATSDLAKIISAGKQASLDREDRIFGGQSPAASIASPEISAAPTTMPSNSSVGAGASTPNSIGAVTPASAAARPPVQASPKVWGDQEAENAGLYEPSAAKPAAVPQGAPRMAVAASPGTPPLTPLRMGPTAAAPAAGPNPRDLMGIINDPYASDGAKAVAQDALKRRLTPKEDSYSSVGDGYVMNTRNGQTSRAYTPEDKTPTSVSEYEYYKAHNNPGQEPMDYATWSTQRARAGATNIANNVDVNGAQSYDKQLAEGLGKSHAALANGVEDAQARARDLAAMQGAVDSIQQNGGTTGGMGAEKIQNLKKTINAGTAALGIDKPFNENDISDKEFLQKFNRQIAGAQAKGAVGNRVTNFEMTNYLKANPGLDMSLTGNQRLLGIQSQIEQRNIAVGNGIRGATAEAISKGQRIDPVTVQKLITDYDEQHHVKDPVNGQDLTQSYTLPEFQGKDQGTNSQMEVGHEKNINGIKIKRVQ